MSKNAFMRKMFSIFDIGERAGSGIPCIVAIWEKEIRRLLIKNFLNTVIRNFRITEPVGKSDRFNQRITMAILFATIELCHIY